jgi:nucleotide-binding universal stress UspA family protein
MKILLGIDGSRYALAATRFVCDYLAQPGRQVDMLHVLPLSVRAGAAPPRQQREHLHVPSLPRSWLDRAERRLQSRGFRVARHLRRGVPARIIPELAARGDYQLVVLGAKGRGDNPYLPTGSVSLAMLESHVPASIVLVRERESKREGAVPTRLHPFPVLFATDGSPRLEGAARSFYHLFSVPELRPIAVAVTELPDQAALAGMKSEDRKQLIRQLGDATRTWAREAKPLLARPGVRPQARALQGRPATVIIEEARRLGAQLVVLGSRGARSPAGPPLGSVALQVARFAPCSVLLVRER